ncbi:hypothetical protein ACS8Y6_17565 [Salinisphaera sp. RV14]|uniref:hypothetical protein n=1 Tax=Salinisphaera sp. RV14 TaxID=3454140 RepID=UPI003F85F444
MRFDTVNQFNIDTLQLDEENYRFSKAADQRACIEKIFASNRAYFKNLMESLADDDLGEPLLVFVDEYSGDHIVLDGNRRLSALKVLYDPSTMAPDKSTRELAVRLSSRLKVDFDKIQAQTSSDKSLILRTVYERHSASGGLRRLDWSALAAARFGYDHNHEGADWKAMALLMELASQDAGVHEFIDSREYSHDIFRRLVRRAVAGNYLESSVFAESQKRLSNKCASAKRRQALKLARDFLTMIQRGEISLSRRAGAVYADAQNIDRLLKEEYGSNTAGQNSKSNSTVAGERTQEKGPESSQGTDDTSDEEESSSCESDKTASPGGKKQKPRSRPRMPKKITFDSDLAEKLDLKGFVKARSLYDSLCKVSLANDPTLGWIGAWAFLEILGAKVKADATDSYGFIKGEVSNFSSHREEKKRLQTAIDTINNEGNLHKHDAEHHSFHAAQIAQSFQSLSPFLIWLLDRSKPANPSVGGSQ